MLLRLLAVQGSWNYETMNGNGIGFCKLHFQQVNQVQSEST